MIDRWEARKWASYSLFATEPECDAFIASQTVPWDWTKTFVSVPSDTPITSPNYTYEEGQKTNVITHVVNDWAFETNLAEYIVPSEMLWYNGDAVFLEAVWSFGANANGKKLKVYVWSEVVYDSTSQIQSWGKWSVSLWVYKSDIVAQKVIVKVDYSSDVLLFTKQLVSVGTTQDMTVDMTIRVTGEWIDPDDVVSNLSVASYLKAVRI
jgi:hypothetical protein